MADNFQSGKNGKVTVNGTEVAVTAWSVQPSSEVVRFRNSRTGNFDKKATTFRGATGSFTIDFDFDASPFGAPLSLADGVTVTNLRLYLNGLTGKFWEFPSAIITGTPQDLTVAGGIGTVVNFENDGTFTSPT